MFKKKLIKYYWILSKQIGIDPLRILRSMASFPTFVRESYIFRSKYEGEFSWRPCFHDRYEEGGATKSEYFWQDLLVAKWIHESNPRRHVDIGSRVDGFVAHVASFRQIEVFDVRPVTSDVPGIVFTRSDVMSGEGLPSSNDGYCDSISCLHALEHFGLGRYGDPLDAYGYIKGISNMATLLQTGGTFYLSTPIGRHRVEFNAHRVFDPRIIIELCEKEELHLQTLIVISSKGQVLESDASAGSLIELANADYNLGVFVLKKL